MTDEELTDAFLDEVRRHVSYWRHNSSDVDKLEGLAFSILALLDGAGSLPAFTLTTEDGGTMLPLHDRFYK